MESPLVNVSAHYHTIDYQQEHSEDLSLLSCGIERCLPGHAYEKCARKGYHLHVVLSGKGRYWVSEQCFDVHSGQMFLLKDMEEVFYQADSDDPWQYVWVTYGGSGAKRCMEMAGFVDGIYVLTSNVDVTEFLNLVIEALKRQHMRVSSEFYRRGLALQFLSLAVESWEKDSSQKRTDLSTDDYIQYAVNFIRSNYQSTKISEVAEYIGISRTYLTELFKSRMYMSPQEYLIQVRMEKSKELLRQPGLSVRTIAGSVGYDDQFSFSRIFKKHFGISPMEFRKRSRV